MFFRSGFLPLFFIPLLLGMIGCNVINPKEEIPTYVQVDSFQVVNTRTDSTGGITHKIRSVFAVYDGKNVGSFDLPTKIPILASGTKELLLYAGVDNSGLYSYQAQYPHYQTYKTTLTAAPGQIIHLTPQTGYLDKSSFYFVETFEAGNDFVSIEGVPVSRTNTPGEVLEGNTSGKIEVDSGNPRTVIAPNRTYPYVSGNSDPFLEIDYKSTAYLQIGVAADNINPYFFLTLLPSPQRNKLYVSLRQAMVALGNGAANFRIFFLVYPVEGQTTGAVIVDDVKVVVF